MNEQPPSPPPAWPKPLAWLLALSGIAVLIITAAQPLVEPDLWWHMAFGRHILDTGRLIVDHSIFTWTEANPVFVYNAWLSEVLLYWLYEATGPGGLIALRYLVYGGFFALAVRFAWRRGIASHPLTWVIILLGIGLSVTAQLVKPELFSFAFMVVTVWLYFTIRTIGVKAWALCYLFPAIVVLWVNSHGAFALSALFFLAIGVGELLNRWLSPSQAMPTRLQAHFFAALALCLPALLLNPFGYELPLRWVQHLLLGDLGLETFAKVISAYKPTSQFNGPPFYMLDHMAMAMGIFVFLLWQKLKVRQTDWVVILGFLAYAWLFVQFVRSAYFLAPVFVFASLDLLAHKEHSWAWPNALKGRLMIALFSLTLTAFIGWRAVQGAICHQLTRALWAGEMIEANVPVAEAEFISRLPAVKKVGNLYASGGYLMFRLWPDRLIAIDGRYQPFEAWIDEYWAFEQGDSIQPFLDKRKADIWLIDHSRQPLMRHFLASKEWRPLFIGPAGVVFGTAANTPEIPPEISPAIAATKQRHALVNVFATALLLRDWSLAERLRSAMLDSGSGGGLCGPRAQETASEMQATLTGYRAFLAGDYETAASNFLKGAPKVFDMEVVAIKALTMAMDLAWQKDSYLQARHHAFMAWTLCPKNPACIYNAAVADWQYRQATPPDERDIQDDLTWEFFADLFLDQGDRQPTGDLMTNVITAMKQGTLAERPFLLVPRGTAPPAQSHEAGEDEPSM